MDTETWSIRLSDIENTHAAIHKVQPKQNRIQYRKPCFRCARNGHTPVTNVNRKDTACQSDGGLYKNNVTREEIHRAAALVGNRQVPNVLQYTSSKKCMTVMRMWLNRSPDTNIIWVSPKVNGTPLRMELDTGSAVSMINKQQFD